MPFNEFSKSMDKIAVTGLDQWCEVCDSQEDICQGPVTSTDIPPQAGYTGMKPELAGGIGALCALAAVGIIAAAFMIIMGFRFTKKGKKADETKSIISVDDSVDVKA